MTQTPEPTDEQLDKLAENLYKRIQKKQEKEVKEQDDQKKEADKPYAICEGCSRLLTHTEYNEPKCPYCGNTKARTITYGTYGPAAT